MPPESWLVVTVASAFLLLGAAGSPLAWAALHHRRSQSEQRMERLLRELAHQVRGIENRLAQLESVKKTGTGRRGPARADFPARRPAIATVMESAQPALISVPNLEASHNDRDVSANGLKERYSAIWTLADTGAAPETIARATGQPIGQIELILGLRRQIVGTRTTISHGTHAREQLERP